VIAPFQSVLTLHTRLLLSSEERIDMFNLPGRYWKCGMHYNFGPGQAGLGNTPDIHQLGHSPPDPDVYPVVAPTPYLPKFPGMSSDAVVTDVATGKARGCGTRNEAAHENAQRVNRQIFVTVAQFIQTT
jgi:hypothetical protein